MLVLYKFKAVADGNLNVTKITKCVCDRVENIVGGGGGGKGENAGYEHFLLFSQCFYKATVSGLLKVGIVW